MGVIILGWSPLLIRWAGAPGVVTAFYRLMIAGLLLVVPFWRKRRKAGPIPRRVIWLVIVAGICYGMDIGLWTTGVTMSGATNPIPALLT